MRAVSVVSLTGPDGVRVLDIPEPTPAPGDVIIEVEAAGLTYPDLLFTRGTYQFKADLPFVLGSQAAGRVRAAPPGSQFEVDDRVAALMLSGAFSERIAVRPDRVFPLPLNVTWEKAAVCLSNYLTAHFVLRRRGRLGLGETVLVHGAAGGIGLASVQVAKALGVRVLAVVSTQAKAAAARASGADEVLDAADFLDQAREATGGLGVDVIVDPVGGDRFTDSLRCLARGGRVVVVGFTGGEIPTVRVNRLLLKNIEVVGAAWGEYALANPGYAQEQWRELEPMLRCGLIDPPIDCVLAPEDTGAGLSRLEQRLAIGNIVLRFRQ
jgi:NADPH:quinone reductase